MTQSTLASGHAAPSSAGPGITLAMMAVLGFACQDVLTKQLAADYDIAQFVTVRYWAFALFVLVYGTWRLGLRKVLASRRPILQIVRSLTILVEIGIFALSLKYLGLADAHAVFATFPLIVTALATVVLGERVGWRRWLAVAAGFGGALVIIRPGTGVFDSAVALPLAAATLFALYHLLTRLASRTDRAETSFVYTGVIGAIAVTPFGLAQWQPPDPTGWSLMMLLAGLGIASHLMLIKALEFVEAATLQPFNYMLLVWAILLGYLFFGDLPDLWTSVGAAIVVASGLYVIWREHRLARRRHVAEGARHQPATKR